MDSTINNTVNDTINNGTHFTCSQCDKTFPSKPRLNEHMKNCHPIDENSLLCKHCSKKFASVPNCIKHEKKCPKSLNLLVTENQFVQVNTEINSSSQRHKYLKNELSVDSEITKFIEKFQNHFTSPTLNSFSTHQLSSTTISTYVSNIKVFASWLLKSYNVDGENALQIIFTSDCLPQYVKYLDVSNYTKKTITNHLLAIQRFILYIKEQISLNSFQNIKSSTQNKKRIEDCCEWVSHQISYLKPIAKCRYKNKELSTFNGITW